MRHLAAGLCVPLLFGMGLLMAEEPVRHSEPVNESNGLKAQRAFLEAMKGSWADALKEGRVAGPILGIAETRAKPGPMSLAPFAGAREEGSMLAFLARNQSEDGHWNSKALGAQVAADVEQTALALLAFHTAGHTEKTGRYKEAIRRGTAWLISRQRADGPILNEGWTEVDGVTHALALLALAQPPWYKQSDALEAVQKGVDYAIKDLQAGKDYERGGFRRSASAPEDLFTTTWFVLSFVAAKHAGLKVEISSFAGIIKFLDSVEDKEHQAWRFLPQGKPSLPATFMGLICQHKLGWKNEDLKETFAAALKELGEPGAKRDEGDVLITCFARYLEYEIDRRPDWFNTLRKNIESQQAQEGPAAGSCAPTGVWSGGGLGLSTSVNAMSLYYYRACFVLYR